MAFANKIGSLLKRAVTSNTASPSMLQAIRSMSSSKLFIGGVSYNTDDVSLKEAFSSHGEVIEDRIIMDRETGRSRGFGFVSFNSAEEASAALAAMDGKLVGEMAFANKIGSLLKRATASNASSPSVFQAIRCTSSSKFVTGGVSYNTHDMNLRKSFSSFGEVLGARNIMDQETGRSQAFPSLSFPSGGGASTARAAMDGKGQTRAGADRFGFGLGLGLGGDQPSLRKTRDFVHILLKSRKKTFVTVTDAKGNKKTGASAGSLEGGRKGRSRPSRYAAEATAEHVGRSARKMGLKSVVVKVKGYSFFRKKKKVIMSWREGFLGEGVGDQSPIMYIHDVTQLPHNGCRLPKKRRV